MIGQRTPSPWRVGHNPPPRPQPPPEPQRRHSGDGGAVDHLPLKVCWFETALPLGPAFGDPEDMTWGSLKAVLSQRREGGKDGTGFIGARFKPQPNGQVRRVVANLISRTLVVLDIESDKQTGEVPPSPDDAAGRVRKAGWAGVAYTSHNHTADAPRYRIVVPLAGEIDPELPAVEVVADALGLAGVCDRSKTGANSLFYCASAELGQLDRHQTIIIAGAAIDTAWIDETAGKLLAERRAEEERIAAEARQRAEARRQAKIDAGVDPNDSVIEKIRPHLDLEQILLSHGYEKSGQNFRHPGSTSGQFGADIKVIGGIERVFSHNANDPLHSASLPAWCGGITAIDAVDVITILEFRGDRTRALRELAERFGIIKPKRPREQDGKGNGAGPPPPGAEDEAGGEDGRKADMEGPRPLRRELPPATPFPIAAFDCAPVLRDAIVAIEKRTQAPLAICGNSVLAATSLCAQAHADVAMPYGEQRPLSDDFVTVAESGDRKTSADDLALRPIRDREAKLRESHAEEMQDYREELDAYTAHKSHLKEKLKKDRQALREALAKLGPEPPKPLKATILVDNPTVEGLEIYAAEGRPSFGLFTAEGGKLIGGHLLNDDNRMKAGATLNLLWDGKPMPRFRRDYGDKLPGRRFSMHVMVQPKIAARMLSDETLLDLGTLARCLVVAPDSIAGTRIWQEAPATAEPALTAYSRALTELLDRKPPTGNEPNELKPRPLPLSPAAREVWITFHDETERKLAPDGAWATIRALGAKLPEHAARLAGGLTIATDPDAAEIGTAALKGGMILAYYYAAEALRLVAAGQTDPDLILAEKLLAWLHANPKRYATHLAEIYQRGPRGIRDKGTAVRIVGILVDHGYLRAMKQGSEVDGKRRREAWAVCENEPKL